MVDLLLPLPAQTRASVSACNLILMHRLPISGSQGIGFEATRGRQHCSGTVVLTYDRLESTTSIEGHCLLGSIILQQDSDAA